MNRLIGFFVNKVRSAINSDSAKQDWLRLPDFTEYSAQAPDIPAFDPKQPHCTSCHSEDLWDYGLYSVEDIYRIHCCLSCRKTLWRSEAPSLQGLTNPERRQAC